MKQKTFVFFLILNLVGSSLLAQKATVKGMVRDENGEPIEQALVTVIDYHLQTITNNYGSFALDVPANTEIRILFQQLSHKDTILLLRLEPKETVNVTVLLHTIGERLQVVNIRSKADEGYIRIDPKLTFQLPSANGGIESVIKMFPGASSTNELSAQYNVRGGNFDENLIFVNDIQVYRPFLIRNAQQEGLSFVNSDLTGNVKFSAGGFEAKYGDKMSSVLDVQYKDPTIYAGGFSASMLGASAHAEGKVDSCFSFLVGVRYKTNAYLLNSLETSGDYKPNFFDTQFLLKWDITKKFDISLLGNISRNSYLYQPDIRETTFGSISEIKRITVYFDGQEVDRYENYLGGLTFSYKPNENNFLKLIISSYFAKESETYDIQGQYWLSDIEADFGNEEGEVAQSVSKRAVGTYFEHARNSIVSIVSAADLRGTHILPYSNTLSWGLKAQNEIIHDHIKEWTMKDSSGYTLPIDQDTVGIAVDLGDSSRLLTFGQDSYLLSTNDLSTYRLTGFIQDVWKIDGDSMPHFILNAGLRFHYWTFNNEFTVSPRLAFIYNPQWKHNWEFSLRTGIYYQPAFYREMRRPDGSLNYHIKSQRSFQIIAGSEYNFSWWRRPFKLTAEAYYKYLDRLVSYTIDNIQLLYSGENDATGYAAGIDLKLSGEFIRGLESWFSVSLMKTAENLLTDDYYDSEGNLVDPGYIPRPTDQRVAFNLFFQDNIPGYPQFRVHLNFVFASGLPYMAPNTTNYDYIRRSSWYRRVDMGFSFMFLEQSRDRMRNKSKFIRSIKNAGIYIEIFNLLGIYNVSSYSWISDINNQQLAIPNYLTGRLINVKFAVDF